MVKLKGTERFHGGLKWGLKTNYLSCKRGDLGRMWLPALNIVVLSHTVVSDSAILCTVACRSEEHTSELQSR